MTKTEILILLALAAVSGAAQAEAPPRRPPAAEPAWTQAPLLLPVVQRRGDRAKAILKPVGIETAQLIVFSPAGKAGERTRFVPVSAEGADIAAPKAGNYHWVAARSETEQEVRVASTVWHFSNPGPAPTEMLADYKHELEILPQPLPREHGSYRESEKWRFLVRYQGQPLAMQPVLLETEAGSRIAARTDAEGVASIVFPRDQQPAAGAGHDGHSVRSSSRFVLSTRVEDHGRRFQTAFNGSYGLDPDRERNLAWGAAFGLLGMIAATPLLRRRPVKETPHA